MATSGVVLRETGNFYALPCRMVNEMRTYFRALIRVEPIKIRMCHVTRIQAVHIIAIWSVSGLLHSPSGATYDLNRTYPIACASSRRVFHIFTYMYTPNHSIVHMSTACARHWCVAAMCPFPHALGLLCKRSSKKRHFSTTCSIRYPGKDEQGRK